MTVWNKVQRPHSRLYVLFPFSCEHQQLSPFAFLLVSVLSLRYIGLLVVALFYVRTRVCVCVCVCVCVSVSV